MPGGDGTGPMGMGSMTGRAMGFCAGYAAAGFANPVAGRGFAGWGRGGGGRGGRGWRNRFHATGLTGWQRAAMAGQTFGVAPMAEPVAAAPSNAQQIDALKAQAEHFEQSLQTIYEQIEQLQENSQQKEDEDNG